MKLRTNRQRDRLFLNGEELDSDGESFFLLASQAEKVSLSDIPYGFEVQICERVIGSTEYCPCEPQIIFENSRKRGFLASMTTPFIPSSSKAPKETLDYHFNQLLESGEKSLAPLKAAKRLVEIKRSIYDDIAYLSYVIAIPDQTLAEAEDFLIAISERVDSAYQPPCLFLCHATEDKPFVDKLAVDLDQRAMFAWYDKREIMVGDSIVEKINNGLTASDFLIAVLSPRSVSKPWVVREMSSSLMRQLGNKSIRILPLLIEACDIPPLLADLKYADFRSSYESGLAELVAAIRTRISSK